MISCPQKSYLLMASGIATAALIFTILPAQTSGVPLNSTNTTINDRQLRQLSEYSKHLQAQAFKELSRMAFRSLRGENYEDAPLERPRHQNRANRRRIDKHRRKNRRRKNQTRHYVDGMQTNRLTEDVVTPDVTNEETDTTPLNNLPNRREAYIVASKELVKLSSQPKCRTALLKQRVRVQGCLTKTVVNKFCYGQCNSFFIPKLRKKKLKAAFESCSMCMPISVSRVLVTLHCPSLNPPLQRKTILKVKDCACKAVATKTLQ